MDRQYDNLTILLLFIAMNFISLLIILVSYLINHFTQLKRVTKYSKEYFVNIVALILCNPNILHYFEFIIYNYEMNIILLLVSFLTICYTLYLNIIFFKKTFKYNWNEEDKLNIKFSSFILMLNSLSLIINYIYNLYFVFYL